MIVSFNGNSWVTREREEKNTREEGNFLPPLPLGHGTVLLVEGINEGQDLGHDPIN